jgi:hypothetical protein
MSGYDLNVCRALIDKTFEGGWAAYKADFDRFHQQAKAAVEEFSPMKKYAFVQMMTGKRLTEYDEIINVERAELTVKIVLSKATVERRSRRDIVTSRELQLWVWKRDSTDEGFGKPDMVSFDEALLEQHHRWGAINTPERHAAIREQFETCYRPGTDKTPLPGWIARLGVSHEQAHENEAFQMPPKRKGKK